MCDVIIHSLTQKGKTMQVKVNTATECNLLIKWLDKFGIPHTEKGFVITFPDMDESLLGVLLSAPELNDNVSIRHLFQP